MSAPGNRDAGRLFARRDPGYTSQETHPAGIERMETGKAPREGLVTSTHVRVTEYGQGPAVVLLHGTPSRSTDFAPLVDALKPTHRVLVLDLPGYCGVPAVSGGERFVTTRRLIDEALRERGIESAAFVGYSGGACRAVDLAVNGTVRATQLVLLAGYVDLPQEMHRGFLDLATAIRSGVDLRPTLPSGMLAPDFLARHPDAADVVAGWLDVISGDDLADEIESFIEFFSTSKLDSAFADLRIPIVAVAGAADQAIPPALTEASKALNDRVRTTLVPGVGHALLLEAPAVVVRLVREALASA